MGRYKDRESTISLFCDLAVTNAPTEALQDAWWMVRITKDHKVEYITSAEEKEFLPNFRFKVDPESRFITFCHYDEDMHIDLTDFKEKVWELNADNDVFQYNVEQDKELNPDFADLIPIADQSCRRGELRVSVELQVNNAPDSADKNRFWTIEANKDGTFEFVSSDNRHNIIIDNDEMEEKYPFCFSVDTYDPYMEINMNEYRDILENSLKREEMSL